MKTLKTILISSLLAAIALLSGCDDKSGGANNGSVKSAISTEPGDYPKFVRAWFLADGSEYSEDASSIAYNPGTRALIEERFKQMEWSNGQAKASFTMQLDAERSLRFISVSDAANDNRGFLAVWTRPGTPISGATTAIVKRSRPLPGVAEALELLHTYVTNDGDIQSVVEWDGSRCIFSRRVTHHQEAELEPGRGIGRKLGPGNSGPIPEGEHAAGVAQGGAMTP